VTSQDNGVSGLKRSYSYICKGEKYVQQAYLFNTLYFVFKQSCTARVFLQTINSTLSHIKANSIQLIKILCHTCQSRKREEYLVSSYH